MQPTIKLKRRTTHNQNEITLATLTPTVTASPATRTPNHRNHFPKAHVLHITAKHYAWENARKYGFIVTSQQRDADDSPKYLPGIQTPTVLWTV